MARKSDISSVVARLSRMAASPNTTPEEAFDIQDLIAYASAATEALVEAKKWMSGQPKEIRMTSVYDTNFAMEEAIDAVLNKVVVRNEPEAKAVSIFELARK